MKILVNGEPVQIAGQTLEQALEELGLGNSRVATAVNEVFVPTAARAAHALDAGDRVEVLAPQQGG